MIKKKSLKKLKKVLVRLLVWLFVFLLAPLVVLTSYHLAFLNRIYPGVKIAGIAVGNKTLPETKTLLTTTTSSLPEKIFLFSPGKTWELDLKALDFTYNHEKTLKKAYQVGRQKNFLAGLQEKKTAWTKGLNLCLEYQLNQALLQEEIEKAAESFFAPAINPQIEVLEKTKVQNKERIVVKPGQNGQELDVRLLLEKLHQNFSQFNFGPLDLPLIKISNVLSEKETENLKARAEKFLEKTLEIVLDEQPLFLLEERELISFISPFGGFDQEKIEEFINNLSSSVDRPAQNASFRFEEGKVTLFKPAREGILVERRETTAALVQKLEVLGRQDQEKQTLALVVAKLEPKVKTEDANNLGIKEAIGSGESSFRGSPASRVHNIILSSSRLNGTLLAPEEVFSFNETLGEVSAQTGYKEAYIIKEGRTILGDGGGVCQVSTTLFRAALAAGLPIIERQPHAYRVGYYEQDSYPGLDATVFTPSPDLKFQNNTPSYILIQSEVDQSRSRLVFALYGENDGRQVTLSKPRLWDQTPPPPPLYQDDPTLPPGVIKQIERPAWGAKVAFDWKVIKDDEVLEERTFYSVYQAWQAIFLKGPDN